jgi:hypothetical protein
MVKREKLMVWLALSVLAAVAVLAIVIYLDAPPWGIVSAPIAAAGITFYILLMKLPGLAHIHKL